MQLSGCATLSKRGTSLQGLLMNDRLKMSDLQTSPVLLNVISSQESEFGLSRYAELDGQTTGRCGPAPVLANLSARQARNLGLMTSGTYGLTGTTSSESANLVKSLQNKFLTLLKKDGLISLSTTWKLRPTPSGRSVSVLTRQAPASRGKGSTLLPSVSAREWRDRSQANILASLDRGDGVAKRICSLSPDLRSSGEVVGLNPCFARWLMNLPQQWDHCMPSETPSMLKRQRTSSGRTWESHVLPEFLYGDLV